MEEIGIKVGQLLQSNIVGDHAIIEIWEKNKFVSGYKRIADGYKDDLSILDFAKSDISEFYYKSYPEGIDITIK